MTFVFLNLPCFMLPGVINSHFTTSALALLQLMGLQKSVSIYWLYLSRWDHKVQHSGWSGAHIICYPGAFNMTTGPAHWELLQKARCSSQVSCSHWLPIIFDDADQIWVPHLGSFPLEYLKLPLTSVICGCWVCNTVMIVGTGHQSCW